MASVTITGDQINIQFTPRERTWTRRERLTVQRALQASS